MERDAVTARVGTLREPGLPLSRNDAHRRRGHPRRRSSVPRRKVASRPRAADQTRPAAHRSVHRRPCRLLRTRCHSRGRQRRSPQGSWRQHDRKGSRRVEASVCNVRAHLHRSAFDRGRHHRRVRTDRRTDPQLHQPNLRTNRRSSRPASFGTLGEGPRTPRALPPRLCRRPVQPYDQVAPLPVAGKDRLDRPPSREAVPCRRQHLAEQRPLTRTPEGRFRAFCITRGCARESGVSGWRRIAGFDEDPFQFDFGLIGGGLVGPGMLVTDSPAGLSPLSVFPAEFKDLVRCVAYPDQRDC